MADLANIPQGRALLVVGGHLAGHPAQPLLPPAMGDATGCR
jgi:hypothetical protein